MRFTKRQVDKIIDKLIDCGIVLLDRESTVLNVQLIDDDYFIEKLEEALSEDE